MSVASRLRRHVFYPLWVARDRSPRLRYLRELERSQYYHRKQLKEHQLRQLRVTLRHAYHNTVWYRELFDKVGFSPDSFKDEQDLKKIPVLSKDTLRTKQAGFLARPFEKAQLSVFRTGGSTGVPTQVLKDFHTVEQINATALRVFRWAGWQIGEPVGMIWGNAPRRLSVKERVRSALIEPVIYLDTMNLTDASMLDFVESWRQKRPTLLRGHSHSIYIFATYCNRHSISDVRPNAIISSSMMLLPSERRIIEQAFACRVTDLYGCEEVGLIACECERHDGMHIDMENNYVELLDREGNDVAPGQQGTVVVTNLLNRAMPLIRYKVGDMASYTSQDCPCGRTLPLLSGIAGRVADFLVRKDGSVVAGVSLVERTLTRYPGIAQMQIIQEDLDNITLKLVQDTNYTARTEAALIRELRSSVGTNNNIRIEYVAAIPQEASGKYRFSVSKLPNPFS